MIKKIEKLTVFFVLAGVFFCSGCGFISVMGTPSRYEKKVPAEYDLTKQKGKKVLVFAEQPGWLSTRVNLRYYLTEAVRANLIARVKVPPKYILSYEELSEFRSNKSDFASLSPAEVGTALGADIVLLVMIEDCQLNELAGTGYFNGSLSVQAAIFESGGGKVWPEGATGKSIKVGFEMGEHGQEAAIRKLVNACGYCISRYLYNCPEYKFKISDEQRDVGWEE